MNTKALKEVYESLDFTHYSYINEVISSYFKHHDLNIYNEICKIQVGSKIASDTAHANKKKAEKIEKKQVINNKKEEDITKDKYLEHFDKVWEWVKTNPNPNINGRGGIAYQEWKKSMDSNGITILPHYYKYIQETTGLPIAWYECRLKGLP